MSELQNATASGVMYRSDKGAILLMRRVAAKDNGGLWAFPAGRVEDGETNEMAARREFHEETGTQLEGDMQPAYVTSDFALFSAMGPSFTPTLNDEHDGFVWADRDNLPAPLHPGVQEIIARAPEHHNASKFPQEFYCRHIQPGLCGYGDENVLVDTDAVKRMLLNNAVGKPVYILHSDASHEDRLRNLKEESAGYITGSFYNEADGWGWFKFLAVDDSAHSAIANGWKVSNAYVPTEWGIGGTKNNVRFDREVLNGYFTHLAIVPDPRYEDACIMTPEEFRAYQANKKQELVQLQNAKTDSAKGNQMLPKFSFFKNERKEVSSIDAETIVEYDAGKVATVGEMINALKEKKNSSDDEAAKKKADEEDEKKAAEKKNAEEDEKKKRDELENSIVDVGGEKITVKELANRHAAMKKNEADKEDEDKKKKDEEEKANALKVAEEKKNGQSFFNDLSNAQFKAMAGAAAQQAVQVETAQDRVARGKSAYGSQQ